MKREDGTAIVSQIGAVVRLEMRKTFLAKRGLWVYLLALMPVVIFGIYALVSNLEHAGIRRLAARGAIASQQFDQIQKGAIQRGMTEEEVLAKLGQPVVQNPHRTPRGRWDTWVYTDGQGMATIRFIENKVTRVETRQPRTFSQDSLVFATVFQFFFLRLSVFFGCVGIFVNLFRGEMVDKSLHYYLLTPVRREVLLAGKYLAGLLASIVIFTSSAALQLLALGWHLDAATRSQYLYQNGGLGEIGAYLGVTVLACVAYGSVFLAAGLVFRNPIVPAAALLLSESVNWFLPAALKKISVIFYLQSLCPVAAPPDFDIPALLRLLISTPKPATTVVAIASLLGIALGMLAIASVRMRRLEITYGAD